MDRNGRGVSDGGAGLARILCFAAGAALAMLPDRGVGQTTTRVSVDSAGVEANGRSDDPHTNGSQVAFESDATNLVPADSNDRVDVFVHDLETGVTSRVSVASSGAEADGDSEDASLDGKGRLVVFESDATNLVPGDTNGETDVFVHDRKTGTTTRVSVDSAGVQGNGSSVDPHTNGRQVVFESDATNLAAGDTNGTADIFVHDLKTGVTTRVSVDSAGVEGDDASRDGILDPKGRLVVFFSDATNLVAGDVNATQDAFLRDLKRGTTTRVSVSSGGVEGNEFSTQPHTNGRQVVFRAAATNLVPGDANGETDIFVRDLKTGVTTRVSVNSAGVESNGFSEGSFVDGKGRLVVFESTATNLVAGDANGATDIFVHDRKTGITTRASVDSVGAEADDDSDDPTISSKGDVLAFESDATNLVPGDGNGEQDVFVRTLK